MKQTAVEFLQESLSIHFSFEQKMQFEGLFQQAKEMEKQQQGYNEEDLLDILNEYRKLYGREDAYKSQLSYFVEQFKKK